MTQPATIVLDGYLRTRVAAARAATSLVVCEEAGAMGLLVVRAGSQAGKLVAMVANRAEAAALAAMARRPLVVPS